MSMLETGLFIIVMVGVVYGCAFVLEKLSEYQTKKNEKDDE